MRAALRLFASVKPSKFLEPHAPTGLTGLTNHPSPRSTLLSLYTTTLDLLQRAPESSVYRQSTEALTRHRLEIVKAVQPEGYEEWLQKVSAQISSNPKGYSVLKNAGGLVVQPPREDNVDPRSKAAEWDGEAHLPVFPEGPRSEAEMERYFRLSNPKSNAELPVQLTEEQMMKFLGDESVNEDQHATPVALDAEPEFTPDQISEIESLNAEPVKPLELAAEPQLTADQISDIESRIGAGLIEEVIQVAEGELGLAMTMIESKVWEELEEKAPEGQWSYFERS